MEKIQTNLQTILQNIFSKLEDNSKRIDKIEKYLHGECCYYHEREQTGKNRVTFPHHMDFDSVRYTIDNVEYTANVNSDNIHGPHIISGKVGVTGDGNKNGYIHFAKNLDPEKKIFFEKKSSGLGCELSKMRSDIQQIKDAAKLIVGFND